MTPPSGSSRAPDFERTLQALDQKVASYRQAVCLTHDNPDPDSMASAAGIAFLLKKRHQIPSRLAYGGIIGRAENRALVRLLKLPMTPISRIASNLGFWALVDTQPATTNHSLPEGAQLGLVIDHHPERPHSPSHAGSLLMISEGFGATSTLVTLLLQQAGLEPDPQLATALFYGVKSDTRALGRESSAADHEVYRWLFGLADQGLLAQIEHPQVPISYFQAYHSAFEAARIQGKVISVDMGPIYLPDIVPEIAERLLSLDGVKWSVALGRHQEDLYLSVRTSDRRVNAGNQVRSIIESLGGSAGGHGQMAGARVSLEGLNEKDRIELSATILSQFADHLGVAAQPATPIV